MHDLLFIAQWWFVLFFIGIIFLPITTRLFSSFFDKGYIFSKIIAISIVSYTVFLCGTIKILPFTQPTIFIILGIFVCINLFVFSKVRPLLRSHLITSWKIFLFEEVLFLGGIVFWAYIRSFQPDIHGLEKYMDFGFVNAILRSEYFPPNDMWFTPFSINYYYFGHLVTAVLTKLSLIPSSITYNLMLTTLFSFTFVGSFSIGANLLYLVSNTKRRDPGQARMTKERNVILASERSERVQNLYRIFIGGILTAFLVSMAGNLHPIYTFFKPYQNENPVPISQLSFSPQTFPNSYWYPNATRFIHNTIHEFPIYSFVVSDLHGHVIDIPFVMLTIAVLFSVIQNAKHKRDSGQARMTSSWQLRAKRGGVQDLFQFSVFNFQFLLLAFLLAIMYMTNAWDGLIYAFLTFVVFIYLAYRFKNYTLYAIRYTLIIIGFVLFSLPFSLHFKPFVSGIGILCAPPFLTNIGKLGPLLFETNHCQHSPLWQLLTLYGFFYFWVISFILIIIKRKNQIPKVSGQARMTSSWGVKRLQNLFRISSSNDIFVLVLILLSTLLIIIPEFIYVKDIYPAHYRANTMFKLVYESFIMLSIASGYIILRIVLRIKYYVLREKTKKKIFAIFYLLFAGILISLVFLYPYFAISSYYGNLQTYYGLDGTRYLQKLYPNDYAAINWLNQNIQGQPVILEAQGDSYETYFARVSANTGLPTVLGWTVHEWLWRGTYDIPSPRIAEVHTLYETQDLNITKNLINKYKISLVFIGNLEWQKYPNLNEQKFATLGKIIFSLGQTKIYKINPATL